jgi:hypothetical protein
VVAAKRTFVVNVRIDGVRETLAAFRTLPKEASDELRTAAGEIARDLAVDAAAAGRAEGHQAALVAGTVKVARDRVPVVQVGGTRRLGRRRVPAWKLLFGSEFGSNRFTQFPRAHQGSDGIWFFPTIEANAGPIAARWRQAADNVIAAFTRGE